MPIPVVERSDREMARRIRRKVRSVEGVSDCREVSIGFTRKKPSIHFQVILAGNPSFEETHKVCSRIEMGVRSLVPNARIVIHSEPSEMHDAKEVWMVVKRCAESEPGTRGVQTIHLRKIDGNLGVDFRLQVSTIVTGKQAQDLEAEVARKLKMADPRISEVVVHQESVSYLVSSEQSGHGSELSSYVEHVARRFPEIVWFGLPTIRAMADGLHVTNRVVFMTGTSDTKVSEITSKLEAMIKDGSPAIASADIIEEQRALGDI